MDLVAQQVNEHNRPGKSLPDGQLQPCSYPVWLSLVVMESFARR